MLIFETLNFLLLILTLIVIFRMYKLRAGFDFQSVLTDIKDKEDSTKLIGDTLVEAIIISDINGTIVYCNSTAEHMFGYPPNVMKGTNVVDLVPIKYKSFHSEGIARLKAGGEPKMLGKTVDLEGKRRDGKVIPIGLSLTKVVTSKGPLYTAVIRDRTEHIGNVEKIAQLNSALEIRLQASEAFNRCVSHDLNAPLRSIDGFSEILEQDGHITDEISRQYVRRIRVAVIKMRQLIKDMLRLSIVTQPDSQLELHKFSISNYYKTLFMEYKMSDPQRHCEVNIQEDMDADVDPELFSLAINNLMSNAWKFTNRVENTVIDVGCNIVNGEAVFFIKDNGVGFDQSESHKLFEPFSRLHTQEEFEGSGIGLTIVKRVIELHKGRVWAEGVVNAGATFYFTIGTKIYAK